MAQNHRNNVLVVGGSSGVGLGVAKLALSHLPNPNVIISSSSKDKLAKAVEEIKASASSNDSIVDYIVGDISNFDTQFDDVEAILKSAQSRFNGTIDHIVWTAGSRPAPNTNVRSNADIIEVSTTRVYGPMTLTYLAKDYMTQSRQSSITVTSGVRIYKPSPGRGRLTGAGGAMDSAARGLAADLAPIRANSVNLGAIHTPLLDGLVQGNAAIEKMLADDTLLKCIGTPEEAAEAYLYSMRCAYATGSRIDVEGGSMIC